MPEALVISLDRLPSHGRQIAEWFRRRRRQAIPLVFVGRAAEKVEEFPARFPEDRLATD
jgi:hypothetical protein